MQLKKRNLIAKQEPRQGVAASELAVCMPVIVLIVLATIESTTMIFLQQSLSVAAYEGARVSLVTGAASTNVKYQSELILQDRGVKKGTVQVTPANIAGAAEGTWIQVVASAPFTDNSLIGGWMFAGRNLSATVEMMKER